MIKPICRDPLFLSRRSEPAGSGDAQIVADLLDTLKANAKNCAGMAANMIGVNRRIIAINIGSLFLPMINPVITKKLRPYEAEEGCLCFDGVRRTTRYKIIEVSYLDRDMREKSQTFTGYPAQIIQHELDHCDGILI